VYYVRYDRSNGEKRAPEKKNTSWSVEFQAESTEEEKQSEEERDRKREVFILGELSFDFEYCPWFY
jgi:hypothetical protein